MQTPVFISSLVLLGFFLNFAAELRISRRNYSILKSAGAEELGQDLMFKFYTICLMVLPASFFEHIILGTPVYREMLLGGLGLIIAGHALRHWAIYSLGYYWTTRCLCLPGMRAVNHGPYRYLNNPEYLSRLLDGVGFALLCGAKFSGLGYAVLFFLCLRKINSLEQRQLAELGGHMTSYCEQPA